jgi:hypothetical protein
MSSQQTFYRTGIWRAPALLVLWQAAPVQADLDEMGRFRFALGFSVGGYTREYVNCAGETQRNFENTYSVIGGNAEAWVTPNVRVSASGGVLRALADSGALSASEGGFGNLLAAREGEMFGIGGGLQLFPPSTVGDGTDLAPAFYLRLGKRDGVHFRIDGTESAAPGTPPATRIGIASGFGRENRPRLFGGLGFFWPFSQGEENDPTFVTAELGWPIGRFLTPVVSAAVPFNQELTRWHVGFGLRVTPGG